MQPVKEWIEEWVNVWPADVRWNNEKIQSPVASCIKKMEKFVKENPQVTKDNIFVATKEYLMNQELGEWKYTMKAHYFIDKQGKGSTLLEYCELAKEIKNVPEEPANNFYHDFI